ncbi:FecR domain-containing protein [Acidovorax sp. SUPP2825]|uniref:FecR domain-containing protein n=1 Tax=Acidovorax sp. SUPP2825 TaxID=2920879 RepID=UPI0023DE20B2|nr:FecR domain-containing protein [Acidovorax sp. SUPP2825]GKS96445.1 FecR domain-containing protein [Acidovorax sp. SUPP2825]
MKTGLHAPALEQATDWHVRLDSDQASDETRRAFAHWLQQAPDHRQAWSALQSRLQGLDAELLQIRQADAPAGGASRRALLAPVPRAAQRRRLLAGGTGGALAVALAAWLLDRQAPLATLAADLRTGTGQRRVHRLPDGSELTLDARSAVDIAYGDRERLVVLREGAVAVRVAAAGTDRPFVVRSAQGTARALGTRFMVRQGDGSSLVHVIEHSVRLALPSGPEMTLRAGDSARLVGGAIEPVVAPPLAPAAWADGVIQVKNAPLGEVLAALRPYSAAVMRVSPAAAQLRIFGVFALDRPEATLQTLVDTHPIAVRRWGPWLVQVDLRPQA